MFDHISSENFKWKQQWEITKHVIEWGKFRTPTPLPASKDVGQQEPSFGPGEFAKWHSHVGRQAVSYTTEHTPFKS